LKPSPFVAAILLAASSLTAASIPSPSSFLGFEIGADRKLADYRQVVSYFRMLDAASARVEIESLGKTTLGEEMIMAVISSEKNVANKQRLKEISRKLADPRGMTSEDVNALILEGKAIVLVTCNIHSTEIASSQMAMEWAHALATAEDAATKQRLDNVVLLLVPSLNPDGQIMETEWYRKYVGTRYEGGRMPWLYHHYVGHDNNRDWFMLTQRETRNLTRVIYHEWLPQLFVDEHQMGSDGPRMFIPPFADPIDPDVHPLIWREVNMVGANMALRLEQASKKGIIYGYSFDAYWLGGTRNTGWWKNITGLLLEIASARMASPLYVDPTDLEGGSKGLIEYKAQINHPNPWRGGWWRMRDIMDYERIASDALLETASERREDLLRNLVTRARSAIESAAPGEAYRIPARQRDEPTAMRLAQLMADHGVEVLAGENGHTWIPLAQPYSRFVREMLEPQRYPEVKVVAGSEILTPYDVATWTLPLMMGVQVERAVMLPAGALARRLQPWFESGPGQPAGEAPGVGSYFILNRASPESAKVANAILRSGNALSATRAALAGDGRRENSGEFYLDAAGKAAANSVLLETGVRLGIIEMLPEGVARVRAPRVGIYKPWQASMDEGWTRWLLEQYGFAPRSLDNKTIRAGKLEQSLDAIILPDIAREIIATGKPKVEEGAMKYFIDLPPEYQGGLDKEGATALRSFVEGGGTLIAFASASEYVMSELNVPVRNALAKSKPADFNSPGSLLRANVHAGHPVVSGLPEQIAVFVDESIVFDTRLPGAEMEKWVLASYPEESRDILLSGWVRGAEKLAGRSAAIAMTYGKGKIVLFGFRPQHRGQTHATFPMLFNALWWAAER